jgi:hypothetical protein
MSRERHGAPRGQLAAAKRIRTAVASRTPPPPAALSLRKISQPAPAEGARKAMRPLNCPSSPCRCRKAGR